MISPFACAWLLVAAAAVVYVVCAAVRGGVLRSVVVTSITAAVHAVVVVVDPAASSAEFFPLFLSVFVLLGAALVSAFVVDLSTFPAQPVTSSISRPVLAVNVRR